MNDNSSRFAKYLELVFAPDGCVMGGRPYMCVLVSLGEINAMPVLVGVQHKNGKGSDYTFCVFRAHAP